MDTCDGTHRAEGRYTVVLLTAVVDGDGTVGLYSQHDGDLVEQPFPSDWPSVVSIDFLRRHCAVVEYA